MITSQQAETLQAKLKGAHSRTFKSHYWHPDLCYLEVNLNRATISTRVQNSVRKILSNYCFHYSFDIEYSSLKIIVYAPK